MEDHEKMVDALAAIAGAMHAIEAMSSADLDEFEDRCEGKYTLPRMFKELRQLIKEREKKQ